MTRNNKSTNSSKNKFLVMPGITKKKRIERGKYLSKRINNLFEEMKAWIEGTCHELKSNKIVIDDVKLPFAEISSNNKLVASLKPAGLWGFGVNCQINIETTNETYSILDSADESSKPDWELIYSSGKKPKKLTKIIFRNFLRKII